MYKKLQAISNNPNTNTGLELVEVASKLAYTPGELSQTLESLDPEIGIVIITSGLADKCMDVLDKYRAKNRLPLITIIPEPEQYIS